MKSHTVALQELKEALASILNWATNEGCAGCRRGEKGWSNNALKN